MIYQASGRDLILRDSYNNVLLAASKSIEITIDTELREVAASNTAGWREYKAGWKKWSFQVSTLVSSSQLDNAPVMVGSGYYANFTLNNSTNSIVSGYCICTQVKVTDQKGQIAKGTFVFQGSGPLS